MASASLSVFIVDGLEKMVEQAARKITEIMSASSRIQGVAYKIYDVFGDPTLILPRFNNVKAVSLITAQRVLLNRRADQQAYQLQQWASLLEPGGRLVVDICHPSRDIGALLFASNPSSSGWGNVEYHQICDAETFEECPEHARRLATESGLIITNQMPAQLPADITDVTATLQDWIEKTRATKVSGSLSRNEMFWFRRRYASIVEKEGPKRNIKVQVELAAVIVVFERPADIQVPHATPTATAPTTTDTTKYDIDQSLTGDARKKAIKAAAKKQKKKAGGKGKKGGGDGDSGQASGASGAGAVSASGV